MPRQNSATPSSRKKIISRMTIGDSTTELCLAIRRTKYVQGCYGTFTARYVLEIQFLRKSISRKLDKFKNSRKKERLAKRRKNEKLRGAPFIVGNACCNYLQA